MTGNIDLENIVTYDKLGNGEYRFTFEDGHTETCALTKSEITSVSSKLRWKKQEIAKKQEEQKNSSALSGNMPATTASDLSAQAANSFNVPNRPLKALLSGGFRDLIRPKDPNMVIYWASAEEMAVRRSWGCQLAQPNQVEGSDCLFENALPGEVNGFINGRIVYKELTALIYSKDLQKQIESIWADMAAEVDIQSEESFVARGGMSPRGFNDRGIIIQREES